MVRLFAFLLVLSTFAGLPVPASAETINIQPGDPLPPSLMDLIPLQFREQLVLLEVDSPLRLRMDFEEPYLINRNDFDIPRTGIPTFFLVDTRNYAPRDIEWVKSNLPAPIHVTPVYGDVPQLSFLPRRLLIFDGKISMDNPENWPSITDVWSGWGGGVRVESVKALTPVRVGERGRTSLTLQDPATIEFTLSFVAFPHYSTGAGAAPLPKDIEITLRPRADSLENDTVQMQHLDPIIWVANPGDVKTFEVNYPAGSFMPSLWIRHKQNGQDISRGEHLDVRKLVVAP